MADEKFFAWLDGELTGADAAEVEARVAADPALRKLADEHRALAARLRSAFDPIAAEPVSLAAYAPAPASNVASLAGARVARDRPFTQRFWAQAAAVAVVFAMGVATGDRMLGGPAGPIAPEAGRLVAAASLKQALYSQLASQPADSGPRIGLTFRDNEGRICRTFTDQAAAGLVCREGGDWRVRAIFQAPEGQGGDYRMATGADPRLAALIDSTISGEPFDAAQERRARNSGWK
ncbi:MAG TPA: anti-sigma factor [Sphingomicrobium sp.]|nr:anti-sigma factor [Sphingomicrobium sp.]